MHAAIGLARGWRGPLQLNGIARERQAGRRRRAAAAAAAAAATTATALTLRLTAALSLAAAAAATAVGVAVADIRVEGNREHGGADRRADELGEVAEC